MISLLVAPIIKDADIMSALVSDTVLPPPQIQNIAD